MESEILLKLLASDPWTEYRARRDILEEDGSSHTVVDARNRMINHPNVTAIIDGLTNWPGNVLNSHKSAGQAYHQLSFLADIGVTATDHKMPLVINKIFKHVSDEGPFQLTTNIPTHFGGTGDDQQAWALCDAPVTVYSLALMGLNNDPTVLKAKNYLKSLGRNNGYPCAISKELGSFRGPGKKEDPCPYATMIMLKLLNLYEEDKNSEFANQSIDSLLDLWEHSRTRHPYIFYMGNDFRKLKAPLIWYDLIHLTDTLSNFKRARHDPRFIDMVSVIQEKAGTNGLFTPESVWKAWKDWDFGQKKAPSYWLTFLVYRIFKRMNEKQ
jgi:hypothetical protein